MNDNDPIQFPLATGEVAQLLQTTEPRVAETVRRGHIDPAPPIKAGRRWWYAEHVAAAADQLGAMTPGLRLRLGLQNEEFNESAGGTWNPFHVKRAHGPGAAATDDGGGR